MLLSNICLEKEEKETTGMKCSLGIYLLLLIIIFTGEIVKAQGELPEFLIGVMIHSSDTIKITQHNNYHQIKDLGVNSVFQIAAKEVGGRQKNLDSLSLFEFIYTANDSGEGVFGAYHPENIDWISYFTHAKYMKWEAEGHNLLNNVNGVSIKHESGTSYNEGGGIEGWRTSDLSEPGDFIIKGPDYWQYPRYTYTNPGWNYVPINYKAVFRMKIGYPSETVMDVCEISVIQIKDEVETVLMDPDNPTVPAVHVLTTEDLSTEYQDFILRYNYVGYFLSRENEENYPSRPTMFSNLFTEKEAANIGMNEGAKVQFKVKWLGNSELFVDYIEVYDEKIWETYFTEEGYDQMVDLMVNYHVSFSELGEKLKYYGTLDEPHVVDCYEPLRRVQEIMDNNNIYASLLSHWYPGWDHYRDGDNTWPIYYELAQPKKINFWYAPFSIDSAGVPHSRYFTLGYLAKNLQQAHLQQPDFYLTLQSWGDRNFLTNEYKTYMYPTNAELGAGTMLALAHGVKGIIYELYYTYPSSGNIMVEGLVDLPVNGVYEPKPLWYKVQELAGRLRGTLGSTLLNLDYTSNYLQVKYETATEGNPVTFDYLTIGNNPTFETKNWFAGLLKDKTNTDNNYFLLTNSITNATKSINVSITPPVTGYYNYCFRDVEGSFDTSFTTAFSKNLTYPAGEGLLFQVSPVIKYGGKILTNDTITTNISLTDNMTLYDTVFIAEDKLYNINSDIDLQTNGFITGNGYITTSSGFSITTNSWSRALLKAKQGSNPLLIWAEHPTLSGIISYKIYRIKESQTFELIATVSGTTYTYIDTTVNIVSGATQQNETIAEYYIKCTYQGDRGNSESSASNTIKYKRVEGSVPQKQGSEALIVYTYNLEQNYPNPFNPSTRINYVIASDKGTKQSVLLKVFDILGNEVATLVNEQKSAGKHSVEFDASKLSSGVYGIAMPMALLQFNCR